MTHGSLFSGVGGFDLAAQLMGWENAFHCEINPFGRHVLNYYWPNAKSYEDITKTDFTVWRGRIDVLTGGFPCQPFSLAGKRKGTDDERHLWPEMLRAIREIKPRWIVGENVFGLINWDGGLVFEQVQADLENEGYEVQPYILPAAGVGAPHRRDRVWFVAYAKSNGSNRASNEASCEVRRSNRDETKQPTISSEVRFATNPSGKQSERIRPQQREDSRAEQGESGGNGSPMGDNGDVTNSDSQFRRVEEGELSNKQKSRRNLQEVQEVISRRNASYTTGQRLRGESDWQDFPTQPPVRCRNDGLSAGLAGITVSKHRNESIKAYGNAIVPQVVLEIFKAIEQYEKIKQ